MALPLRTSARRPATRRCRIRRGWWPRSTGSAGVPEGDGGVRGLFQDAPVEGQPGKLTVEETPRPGGFRKGKLDWGGKGDLRKSARVMRGLCRRECETLVTVFHWRSRLSSNEETGAEDLSVLAPGAGVLAGVGRGVTRENPVQNVAGQRTGDRRASDRARASSAATKVRAAAIERASGHKVRIRFAGTATWRSANSFTSTAERSASSGRPAWRWAWPASG